MNARDELASIIGSQFEHPANPNCHVCADTNRAAEEVLAAGYRKPRTITTAEELDALPAEVVVRSSVGVVWEKYADDYSDGDGIDFWQQVGLQRMYASSKVTLPATVLYEPEARP